MGGLWRGVNYTVNQLMHSECGRICRGAVGEGGLIRGGLLYFRLTKKQKHTYKHTNTHARTQTHTHTSHTHTYTYTYVCIHTHPRAHTHIHTCTHTLTRVHARAHSHTHTHSFCVPFVLLSDIIHSRPDSPNWLLAFTV